MPSVVRAGLRAWYAFKLMLLRRRRRARDSGVTRTGDPRADRVLLLGNGVTHGWDVDSHREGVVGRLGAELSLRTGRGADVDLVGAEAMSIGSALAWVGDRDLAAVDALVIALGLNDALRRTPVADWETGLRDLLAALVARLPAGAPVVVTGIPGVDALPAFDGVLARLAAPHRARLDAATAEIATEYGVVFVDRPEGPAMRRLPVDRLYRGWAVGVAEALAPELLVARPEPRARAPQPDPIWEWSGTQRLVELAEQGGAPKLRKLAIAAQKRFRVELAVVSLKNGDRLYYANNTDVMPASVPLDFAFCRHTIESGTAVIVPDARNDERFAGNPLLDLSFINFYAGYPLRASDGTVIGSFCLQGSRPRSAGAVPLDTLRAFALEAEAEIRRFELPLQPGAPTGSPYSLV